MTDQNKEASYATRRKIRKIEEALGPDWQKLVGDRSIDSVYNDVVGDTRKNLFCKVESSVKEKLDEMVEHHRTRMAEFIEHLIISEWARFQERQREGEENLLREFSGSS